MPRSFESSTRRGSCITPLVAKLYFAGLPPAIRNIETVDRLCFLHSFVVTLASRFARFEF